MPHLLTKMESSIATALIGARLGHTPATASPWQSCPLSPESAWTIQAEVGRRLGWFPGFPTHWKYSAAGRTAVSQQTPLPPGGILPAGSPLSSAGLHHRLVEAEIALRLACPVSAQQARELLALQTRAPENTRTLEAIDELIGAAAVSAELVDTRWQEGLRVPAPLMIADQQGHGALLLGEWQDYRRRDWSRQCLTLVHKHGGDRPVTGTARYVGTHPLGDPAWLVPQWLVALTADGSTVPAGTIVTTGSWNGMSHVGEGETLDIDYEGFAPMQIS